jgi:hypothetical protein
MINNMKHIISFSICALSFLACNKDSPAPTPPTPSKPTYSPLIELGKIAYKKKGIQVEAIPKVTFLPEKKCFYVSHRAMRQGIQESCILSQVPSRTGDFAIKKRVFPNNSLVPSLNVEWILDFDQFLGGIEVDDDRKGFNYVKVIRHDSTENVVEGIFQVFLKTMAPTT